MNNLISQLISLSDEALERGHHETAYHTLLAAFHYAKDMQDVLELLNIEFIAKKHLEYIDRTAPHSILSSESAKERRNVNMYYSLMQMASMRAKTIRDHQRRARRRQRIEEL